METIVNRMALSTTRAATRLKPVSPRNRSINSTTKIASITPSRKAISNLLAGTMSSSLPGEAWRTSSIPDRAGRAAHRTTKSWVGPDSSPIVTATSGMQLASHPKSLRLGAHAATVVDVLITSSPDWIARTARKLYRGIGMPRRVLHALDRRPVPRPRGRDRGGPQGRTRETRPGRGDARGCEPPGPREGRRERLPRVRGQDGFRRTRERRDFRRRRPGAAAQPAAEPRDRPGASAPTG